MWRPRLIKCATCCRGNDHPVGIGEAARRLNQAKDFRQWPTNPTRSQTPHWRYQNPPMPRRRRARPEPGRNRLACWASTSMPTQIRTSRASALINSALVNYERLPMLEIVFDRLVRMMSTRLRNLPRITSKSASIRLPRCVSAIISIRSPCRRCSMCSRPRNGTIPAL